MDYRIDLLNTYLSLKWHVNSIRLFLYIKSPTGVDSLDPFFDFAEVFLTSVVAGTSVGFSTTFSWTGSSWTLVSSVTPFLTSVTSPPTNPSLSITLWTPETSIRDSGIVQSSIFLARGVPALLTAPTRRLLAV